MNKVKRVKNILLTSIALLIIGNKSYKLVKGDIHGNKVINNHLESMNHGELVVAHRGFSGLYPENSWESINKALELDCVDMIEIDIRYTKDKQFVLHHDSLITSEDIKIKIEDLELNDDESDLIIKRYPFYNLSNLPSDDTLFLFKRYLKSRSEEEHLLRLNTVLKYYDFSKPLILDIKTDLVDVEMINKLNKILKDYKDRLFIQAYCYEFLDTMKEMYPDYKYLYIIKSENSLKKDIDNFYGYTVKYSLLDKIHIKNDKLYLVYTINSSLKYLNLLNNKNYSSRIFIITDNPDYICALSENKKLRKE